LAQIMGELHEQYPDDRERSLYASVELSLRRLPEDVRRAVDMLAVFHGGVNERVWEEMKQTESYSAGISFQKLQNELTRIGLAQVYPYGHMLLHPAIAPYLKTKLSTDSFATAKKKWAQGMLSLAKFLYDQLFENKHLTTKLTLLELPNLIALLAYTNQLKAAEGIVLIAGIIEDLLKNSGLRQILKQVISVQENAEKGLKALNNIKFYTAKRQVERLLEKGSLGAAQIIAKNLLKKSLNAGENAYPEAAYNIAEANILLGIILKKSAASESALNYLESAQLQFDKIGRNGDEKSQRMAYICLAEQGDCLRALGRLDESASIYEESIAFSEKHGDLRQAAAVKANLGWVRLDQKQYRKALKTYESAIELFESLNEPINVATGLHLMGMVHDKSGNYPAAETAYRNALRIRIQYNNISGEADSLLDLGTLLNKMGQLEEAVKCYRQATNIYVELGDLAKEGSGRNNLARTFISLKRYDEALQEIEQAIECLKPFGYSALPWNAWHILSTIEYARGNSKSAKVAREQAKALYMDFRRSGGGKYEVGVQVCSIVEAAIQSDEREKVEEILKQFGKESHPLIKALQQILDGVRHMNVIVGLEYDDEVNVRLLLEKLGG